MVGNVNIMSKMFKIEAFVYYFEHFLLEIFAHTQRKFMNSYQPPNFNNYYCVAAFITVVHASYTEPERDFSTPANQDKYEYLNT